MTLQVSTKFKELILGTNSFAGIFAYGQIRVYSGIQPATADYPVSGTLLATITDNGAGGGLIFQQFGAWVSKSSAQTWRMAVTTTGTAAWFRLVGQSADTGAASYSLPRVDGNIGTSSSFDMTVSTTALTAGTTVAVQQFLYTIPPLL